MPQLYAASEQELLERLQAPSGMGDELLYAGPALKARSTSAAARRRTNLKKLEEGRGLRRAFGAWQ